ncbi:phospholipase D-like domain-containing protein [Acinetobacter indicus]|uniref:phospholipase D-like domain-containing protein n=1 Tax=Acinetobacter indicus TaxID=756892 RepID=UPI0014444166|nr:phospholipase D-like domain-containing protein [Acinetobacter indicus]
MQISLLSINEIAKVINGDDRLERRTGPELVELFNFIGFEDDYWALNNQGLFGRRADYTKEKLLEINGKNELVQLIEILVDDRQVQNVDEVADALNKILKHDKYQLIKNTDGVYKLVGEGVPEDTKVTPVFDGIEKEIIDYICSAKYSIWVAVAWITSRPIATALYAQHKNGLNVRIVVNDDDLTNSHGIKFQNTGIEYYKISPQSQDFKNLMHHKFCILDLKRVITGSFNWTNRAGYNNENIAVIENREKAESFADEFLKLIGNFERK